jgi:uncharacterized SAM-binding protein YcdF (DUF218 family)
VSEAARRPPQSSVLKALAAGGSYALCLWLCAAMALELYGATRAVPESASTVVVAGAGVLPDGAPSHSLYMRTAYAVALFRRTAARTLAFTGGSRALRPAEAEVAERIAAAYGVPADVMVREARSTSTEENARELSRLLGDQAIVVVTDRFHVLRCERVFGRYFADVRVVGVVSPPLGRMWGALREVAALAVYGLMGRL